MTTEEYAMWAAVASAVAALGTWAIAFQEHRQGKRQRQIDAAKRFKASWTSPLELARSLDELFLEFKDYSYVHEDIDRAWEALTASEVGTSTEELKNAVFNLAESLHAATGLIKTKGRARFPLRKEQV